MRNLDNNTGNHTEAVLAEIAKRGWTVETPVTGAVIVEGVDVTTLVEMIDVDPADLVDAIAERIGR